jgi:hypothetical protein
VVLPPVAQLRPGLDREQRLVGRVGDDEPLVLGAQHRDPVAPLLDAEEHRRLLAEVLDEDLARLLRITAALEHQVALECARGASELDLVGATPPVRLRGRRDLADVDHAAESEEGVLECERTTGPFVWLGVEPRSREALCHRETLAPARQNARSRVAVRVAVFGMNVSVLRR